MHRNVYIFVSIWMGFTMRVMMIVIFLSCAWQNTSASRHSDGHDRVVSLRLPSGISQSFTMMNSEWQTKA
jgi:hypothetical protein